jgi:hypothetical protein
MALPSFATYDDLVLRLPENVTVDEDRAEAALFDASALIHAESAEAWVSDGALVDDVPDVVLTVCCKAAIRALVNPAGNTQEATGPFSTTFGDVYLTSKEAALVRGASGGTGGLWTLSTTRLDTYETSDFPVYAGVEYIPVIGQDEPIPYREAT